jgi:O-antigen/teichoic acid export membrane protein
VSDTKAVGAGRGLLFITAAKLWFMVAGYVVQFGLPRALGSPEAYGIWILVTSWLSPVNNVMVTATIQTVSKFTSETEGRVPSVTRAALRMQTVVGGLVALAFLALAPVVASAYHQPGLAVPFAVVAGVVLCYSFYAVLVGAANGARAFHKQAGLDATFSTLRAALVVGGALLFHSVSFAAAGFVAAAAIILVLSLRVIGPAAGLFSGAPERFPMPTLARLFGTLALYLGVVNLMMFVDSMLLPHLVYQAAERAGAANPAQLASAQEGFYGAAQNVARIPYQLILAVTFVIFPLVSKSTFAQETERTRTYVRATMRYSLVVVALLAATLGSRPDATLRLFYKPEYAVGATGLIALLAGYVCFSLFNIAGTILNGAGHTRATTFIGITALAISVAANWIAISWALASGRDPLLWAALSTAVAMFAGLLLSGLFLLRSFGAFLPPLSLLRVSAATAAAYAVGRYWPTTGFLGGKLGTLVSMSCCGLAFLMVAVGSGELRPAELKRLRKA